MTIVDCLSGRVDPLSALLFIGAFWMLWILWRIQRSPKYHQVDLVDLIIGPDGKASWSKMAGIGGYMIGSWIVVYQTLHDKLSDFLFLSYFAVCIGSPVAFAVIGKRNTVDPLPLTVSTVTEPSGTTTTTTAPVSGGS